MGPPPRDAAASALPFSCDYAQLQRLMAVYPGEHADRRVGDARMWGQRSTGEGSEVGPLNRACAEPAPRGGSSLTFVMPRRLVAGSKVGGCPSCMTCGASG